MFGLKNMCENFIGKGRYLYVTFMDIEKAYDSTDRTCYMASVAGS